jgi:hypothetical protein
VSVGGGQDDARCSARILDVWLHRCTANVIAGAVDVVLSVEEIAKQIVIPEAVDNDSPTSSSAKAEDDVGESALPTAGITVHHASAG